MASGVPVICTAETSMAEFAASAPLLFERGMSEEFAQRLSSLLENDGLRQRHKQLGLERARHFTWQRFAQETLAVYRAVSDA